MNQDNNVNNNFQLNSDQTQQIPVVSNPVEQTQQIPVVNPAEQTQQIPVVNPLGQAQQISVAPSNVSSSEEIKPRTGDIATTSSVKMESANIHIPPENINEPIVSEKLKKVEIEYKPPSSFKLFLMFVFFLLLLFFIIFLPDIQERISLMQSGHTVVEKIETGKLNCSLKTNTYNLDINYHRVFEMVDNKLTKVSFTIETKGDVDEDAEALQSVYDKCEALDKATESVEGVNISCVSEIGKITEKQSYNLPVIDSTNLRAIFNEVGVEYPGYSNEQDMDKIERNMKAAGYTCEREKQ